MRALLFWLCCLPTLLLAQSPRLFVSGAVEFDYSQVFGPFSGHFEVAGEIDTTDFTPTFDAGVGGIATPDSTGSEQLICLAAEAVPEDTTWNVFGLWLRSPTPLQPGPVPDPTTNANLFLLWHLDSLALPTELPDSLDLTGFLDALVAQYKLVGAATALSITSMEDDNLSLSFSGAMLELDFALLPVTISNGTADLVGLPFVSVGAPPLAPVSPRLLASPNPFNPSTRLSFALPQAGAVVLEARDLLGRLADRRELGHAAAGPWSGSWAPTANLASGNYGLTLLLDGRPVGGTRVLLLK